MADTLNYLTTTTDCSSTEGHSANNPNLSIKINEFINDPPWLTERKNKVLGSLMKHLLRLIPYIALLYKYDSPLEVICCADQVIQVICIVTEMMDSAG